MKQITEDYVSYEIAVLLKDKGFTEPVQKVYNNKGDIVETYCDYTNQYKYHDWLYPCPTHQMALKWLREVHKIFIEVNVSINLNGTYHYAYSILDKECKYIKRFIGYYSNNESCVEAALSYVLKNLI